MSSQEPAKSEWATRDSAREVGEVLIDATRLSARVAELGAQITADYQGRQPLMVGVLKGAFIFLADLVRACRLPLELDFMAVSSYGQSTISSGVVRIVKDLDFPLEGRDVMLVEDIVDSGLTLDFLVQNLEARRPASLEVCALLVREGAGTTRRPRYIGFGLPPDWVVGYGLDAGQRNRHLPAIHRYVPPA